MPNSRKKADNSTAGPYFRLSLAYVGVFGHLGIVMPGFALWLDDRGYGMTAIGVLLALPAISKMLNKKSRVGHKNNHQGEFETLQDKKHQKRAYVDNNEEP